MIKRWGIIYKCGIAVLTTFSIVFAMELINLGSTFQFSLAPVFVIVAGIAFIGGLRCGLTSSIVAIGYAFYNFNFSPRFFIASLSFLAITSMVGYLKRRARLIDTLNGNITSVKQALAITRFLRAEWQQANEKTVNVNLEQLEDLLGNLASRILGWHKLREEMREVEMFYREGYKNNETSV